MIHYTDSLEGIAPEALSGFCVGWQKKPSVEVLLKALSGSDYRVLALDEEKRLVGFVTAITDGTLSAYLPLLEVLPEFQGKGIGRELIRRMLEKLKDFYMIDLSCDPELQPLYEKFGMRRSSGMMMRNLRSIFHPPKQAP